jgi:predicted CXXCH cytochrome family protein
MNNKLLIAGVSLICFAAGYYIFYNRPSKTSYTAEVSFSHYVHTKEHKIKCTNCHRGAETQMRAGIPNTDYCGMCHSSVINPSSEREKVIYQIVKDNKVIQWRAYYNLPDYVYFSHRRHVKLGKLDCTACHGDMSEQTSPELKNYSPVEMKLCFNCHEDKGITTDCGNCHH